MEHVSSAAVLILFFLKMHIITSLVVKLQYVVNVLFFVTKLI